MLGIIGGSGFASFAELVIERREIVRTPYGEPSGPITFGRLEGREVAFLPRHGSGHTIAPHEINYRANIWALKQAGVSGVIAVVSVGAILADAHPGTMVLPDQVIDYTWGRASSYFDSPDVPITHIDFTLPFDSVLRDRLLVAAQATGQPMIDGACYACMQGPRLETAAEINRLERDGAHLVGMTLMPEAALARELELPYAALGVVVNHAAGRGGSALHISVEAIGLTLDRTLAQVRAVIMTLVRSYSEK